MDEPAAYLLSDMKRKGRPHARGCGRTPGTAQGEVLLERLTPIIDDVGFRSLDRHEANFFFRLVCARYEKGSIILNSNKHVRD